MLKSVFVLVLASLAFVQTPDAHPLAGEWEGTYVTAVSEGTLWLKVGRANQEWSVALKATSPFVEEPDFQPASAVTVDRDAIAFVVHWGPPVAFKGTLEKDVLGGEMIAEHWSGPGRWSVRRAPSASTTP